MSIKVGDRVPDGTLTEFIETESEGCSLGPNAFQVADLTRGKTIALFALPGAFTPTCSAKHLPGYVEQAAALKAKGVDEIWCVSVNDAFVMGAWGREQKTDGKVRMLADGSALWTKALGLELDLIQRGMGVRSTLLGPDRRRRGQAPERRRPRQVRSQRRRDPAVASLISRVVPVSSLNARAALAARVATPRQR